MAERRPKQLRRRGSGAAGDGAGGVKSAQLIIDCKYANELPKPPVPKLLKALPSADKLCQYKPTQLELDHRPFLLSEQNLLARIEMVDPDAYGELPTEGSMPPPPPPQDAQLLRDDDIPAAMKDAEKKRKRLTEHTESWHRQAFGLQLPQLITNDVFTERQRFTTGLEASEKKLHRDAPGFDSVEELAGKIENTFEAARDVPVHPSNPSLKPKRILPIVPDAVLWANRYRQIYFDELLTTPARNDLLYRTQPHPRVTCFGYFSPNGDSAESGSYKLEQTYVWENKSAYTKQVDIGEFESVILSFPPDSDTGGEARFVPVPSLMKLKKQKATRLDIEMEVNSLTVKHTDPSAQEAAEEQERMMVVLSDEVRREHSEASLDYVDGEWQIRGDPRSQPSADTRSQTETGTGTMSLRDSSVMGTATSAQPSVVAGATAVSGS